MKPTARCPAHRHDHAGPQREMDKQDYEIQATFERLCEQILDYLGPEDGYKFLMQYFATTPEFVQVKFDDYMKGNRITEKLKVPDKGIVKICQGWKK